MTSPSADDDEGEGSAQEIETRKQSVSAAQHGQRLDRILVEMVPEFSRSYLQKLIADGAVRVNGEVAGKAAARIPAAQVIEAELRPTPDTLAFRAEPVPLDIVYEDAHLLVINKPAGLVVHPAAGNWSGTLLNGLLAYDSKAAQLPRAGIVHRLDKDTSGLMLVGRTLEACTALVRMIAAREVRREYLALAHGSWPAAYHDGERVIEAPIGRDPKSRLKMAVVSQGKPARTDVTLLEGNSQVSLVQCRLHTGRTHQIRVHMAFIGHALVGDLLYGGQLSYNMTRQALHACRLSLQHPVSGQGLYFEQECPKDISLAVRMAGLGYNL